jgi:hypothetical protein
MLKRYNDAAGAAIVMRRTMRRTTDWQKKSQYKCNICSPDVSKSDLSKEKLSWHSGKNILPSLVPSCLPRILLLFLNLFP